MIPYLIVKNQQHSHPVYSLARFHVIVAITITKAGQVSAKLVTQLHLKKYTKELKLAQNFGQL